MLFKNCLIKNCTVVYITKETSFDLSEIRDETFPVHFNLKGFHDQIIYA